MSHCVHKCKPPLCRPRTRRGTIAVPARFPYVTQRFTAAHELGHYVLHPGIGDSVVHRDRPVNGAPSAGRPPVAREAGYFAACLLMPRGLVEQEFIKRFGSRRPLALTEAVAFHLGVVDIGPHFSAQPSPLQFVLDLARAEKLDRSRFPSVTEHLEVSATAMAIKLRELDLVAEYFPAY